jgi:uncharacterized protein YciI
MSESTWVALLHEPGPAALPDTNVFEQPQFQLHVAFLRRMREQGFLVSAGPITDAEG